MNNSNPSVGFKPLNASDFLIFSEKTRREMVWDLASAGEIDRIEALLDSTPLLRGPPGGYLLDLDLCALLLWKADEARFPIFLDAIALAALGAHPANLTGYRNSPDKDFGSLASAWALRALDALGQSDAQSAELALGRVVALCLKRKLPMEQHNSDAFSSYASRPHALYGFLTLEPGCSDRAYESLKSFTAPPNSLLAWAMALGVQGSMTLLGALCERPTWRASLAEAFSGANPSTRNEFSAFHNAASWRAEPVFMEALLRLAEDGTSTPSTMAPEIALAMIEASESDWNAPCMQTLRLRAGDECLALALRKKINSADQRSVNERASVMLFATNPQAHPALGLWMQEFFKPPLHVSRDLAFSVCSLLRQSLFSPLPGLSELAQASWKLARGDQSNPWNDCYLGANPERYLEALCHCGRPDLVGPALSGWGLAGVQAFPNARKGLDSSATMWIMEKSPLPIFEAALDWFSAQGALSEQAEAKAWVYQGAATRKKGDLLAACVACGKLEAAESLLARMPHLDTRFAREVAKTMGEKAQSDEGGAAVSAWEALLLRRELKSGQIPKPFDAPSMPRRPRL